ncbi:MAG: peptidase domain-containing ABC transporter, partial [Mesorhizobium sp.]
MLRVARYHGIELDPNEFRAASAGPFPSATDLSEWAQNGGMWSRAVRVRWSHLLRFQDTGPVVLLFSDGGAGLLTGASAERNVVFLKSPEAPDDGPSTAVDELRLSQVWTGEAVLLRNARSYVAADAPFTLRWIAELVRLESRPLRDVAIASFTLSVLTILPPLIVMTVVNKVLQFNSVSTLLLLSAIVAVVFAYETLLGH